MKKYKVIVSYETTVQADDEDEARIDGQDDMLCNLGWLDVDVEEVNEKVQSVGI